MSTLRAASTATFMLFSLGTLPLRGGLLHFPMSRPSIRGIRVAFSNYPLGSNVNAEQHVRFRTLRRDDHARYRRTRQFCAVLRASRLLARFMEKVRNGRMDAAAGQLSAQA